MRRLLLTTAAALGVAIGFAGAANAQIVTTTPPPPAGEPGPTYGMVASPPSGASSVAMQGETAPNSFVVHLNGRLVWYAGVGGSSANQFDGYKLNPQSFQGYMRLYPGFNATAANGLKYGFVGEIRQPGSTLETGGATPGSTSATNTLYWRRAYGYVGTDEAGSLRIGMTDGPMSLFQVGTFESFDDGAWNSSILPEFVPSNTDPVFAFSDVSNLYTGNKIVYLSPNFSGFEFGLAYEPNTSNLVDTPGSSCSTASSTCIALSASPVPGASIRRKNMIDVGGRYTNTFDGVGVDVGVGYVASETVNAPAPTYNGLSVGKFGATLTYAGFTFGGNITYGNMNGDFSLQPRGGVNTLSWMVGGQYAAGPCIVGASFFKTTYPNEWTPANGALGVARTGNDNGFAAGATYLLAPGMALYLSYLYGERHQIGWDFNSGKPSPDQNNTHANIFALGAALSW